MKKYSLFSYLLIFHEQPVTLAIVKIISKKLLRLITNQDIFHLEVSETEVTRIRVRWSFLKHPHSTILQINQKNKRISKRNLRKGNGKHEERFTLTMCELNEMKNKWLLIKNFEILARRPRWYLS